MALSNAEKQARYRERVLNNPDTLTLTRIQVLVKPGTAGSLNRIAKATGLTQREVLEMALSELENKVCKPEHYK